MKRLFAVSLLGALATACSSAPYSPSKPVAEAGYVDVRMPAAECAVAGDWETCKNGRSNDWADQYLLSRSGDLFAYKRLDGGRTQKCQVTNKVSGLKVSQHKNDVASIYFEREGDLYILVLTPDSDAGKCPKQNKKVLLPNVKEYKVVSNTRTDIVNAAVDRDGRFYAWDHTKVVYSESGVEDFEINSCYGADGKSFKSNVLFTIDRGGQVTKVKGDVDGRYAASKGTAQSYRSLADFKSSERVCEEQR